MLRIALLIATLTGCLAAFSVLFTTGAEAASSNDGFVRWAYYVPDDPASLASLRQRAGDLDYAALHWATMREDGAVEVKANPEVISLVRSLGARPILSVTAGSADFAHSFLATDASIASAADALAGATADYDGISVDFEGLYPEDRDALTRFMARLAAHLRPAGKLVTMALSAKSSDTRTGWAAALDYAALAPNADLFIVMGYGYRTARSAVPGSVAPMPWVQDSLAFAASQIPREKILLGVPLYGYDWDTAAGPPAKALRFPETLALAGQPGAAVQHDRKQMSARLTYSKDGHNHEVWFEDRATVEAKLALVADYGLAGAAVWRLGHEDPDVWKAVDGRLASRAWYFAEGSTARPFDTWILLQNPNPTAATATVTFLQDNGATTTRQYTLAPTSRFSLYANEVVPNAAISTRVDSDRPILAERAMYFRTDGHGSPGARGPAYKWYLAEGSTAPPFDTWILVMNPNPTPVRVTFTLMAEGGVNKVVVRDVGPTSRYSLFANEVMPGVAFSSQVEGDAPIIVERAMYFNDGGGHGTTGVTALSRNWYLADGDTRPGFDTWLLLMNPNDAPAHAKVTFAREDGLLLTRDYTIGPRSRFSVFANQVMPGVRLSPRVEADQPVIAERAMYFGNRGGHDTVAARLPARVWYLAEGSTGPPFTEYVLIANPSGAPIDASVTWMQEGGRTSTQNLTIAANARATLNVNQVVPNAAVSARVEATAPVVVERSMYFSNGNGGTNTIGVSSAVIP